MGDAPVCNGVGGGDANTIKDGDGTVSGSVSRDRGGGGGFYGGEEENGDGNDVGGGVGGTGWGLQDGGVGQGMGAILASASRTTNSFAGTKGARGRVTVREVRAVRVRVRVRAVRVRVRVRSIGIRDTEEGKA